MRRGGVTLAVSTEGRAPALAGLLREALEAVIPEDVGGVGRRGEPRCASQQKADGVPMGERRPLLLEALNRLYAERAAAEVSRMSGFVSLVGAGPGDPDLLTVRAARDPRRRPTSSSTTRSSRRRPWPSRPRAQRFCVGKRARARRRCARRRSTRC